MTIDLTPATTILIDYSMRFAYADFSAIRCWINEGADLELDIVPAIQHCISKRPNGDIKALGYFRHEVMKRRDSRKDTDAAKQAIAERNGHLEATADERRAKHIAFLVRKLGRRMPNDERWLAGYEAEHGVVAI